MDLITALKQFGFTGQEAQLYLVLLQSGEASGYEAAKLTGISRSNAYSALSNLVEKGIVIQSNNTVKKFVAISKADLVNQLERKYKSALTFLENNLPEEKVHQVPYFTISGNKNIMNRLVNIIDLADERIYISIHSKEFKHIKSNIETCINRGIKTVIISNQKPAISGIIFYQQNKEPGYIKVIADTAKILTCDLSQSNKNGLYSEEKHMVKIMRESILNEIELYKLKQEQP